MLEENPYRSTVQPVSKKASNSIGVAVWWVIYLHPAIALVLMHSCWAITAFSLGRSPRFGEHPENDVVHTVVHVLDLPAMLLILGTPIFIPTAVWQSFARPFAALNREDATMRMRVVCLIVYLLILAITAGICSCDPFRVIYWFMD